MLIYNTKWFKAVYKIVFEIQSNIYIYIYIYIIDICALTEMLMVTLSRW